MPPIIKSSLEGNFLTRFFKHTLSELLPRRIKRLFYISSALSVILQDKTPDLALVTRLNVALNLAYGAVGMLFPAYIGFRIWSNIEKSNVELCNRVVTVDKLPDCVLCDMDCWKLGLFFAKNSPEWMQYGSQNLMTTDVHDMMISIHRIDQHASC